MATSKNIRNSVRGSDLVFRWGGDEIVVVLTNSDREGYLIAADRIRQGVQQIKAPSDRKIDVSIGVAFFPEHGSTAEELIRTSDRSLYIAKKGGDRIHVGAEEYILNEQHVHVVFQPIVAVQPIVDKRSNEVFGFEALARDPQGKLSPLELFKKYRSIGKLHDLKCVCFQSQVKKAKEVGLQRAFINVDFNVLDQLEAVPPPEGLEVILEISEAEVLIDLDRLLRITKKWREKGYKFAIDDFGAGFISLPFIARMIPDYIKVDRSTVLQAVSSPQFKNFLKGVASALRTFSKEGIIAEGIETEKELEVMMEIGIYMIQGYLMGKPQPLPSPG